MSDEITGVDDSQRDTKGQNTYYTTNVHEAEDKDLEHRYEVDAFVISESRQAGEHVNFRSMGWVSAGLVATAEAIALGLLSFPSAFLRLGMLGGIISTIGFGVLAYVTGCMMIDFKVRHMGVMHFGDAGSLMFGSFGRIWFGAGLVIKSAMLGGSHVLVGETALSYLSNKALCGVWFGLFVAIVSIVMSVNREWGKLHYLSALSLTCIIVSSLMVAGATGTQDPSVLMKKGVPIEWRWFPSNPNLVDIIGGLTNMVFGYGGNLAVFSFCSEMRNPKEFKKSLLIVQGSQIFWYTIIGAVIYRYGGQYTVSPALTMAARHISVPAYSVAVVTIMVSGILAVNVAAKYIYLETLRGKPMLTSKSWKAWAWWMCIIAALWSFGFVIASVIPFFNQLSTVISSVFSVWFAYGYVGILWLWDNHPKLSGFARDSEPRALNTLKKKFYYGLSLFVIIISVAVTPLGLYSAAIGIRNGYRTSSFKHPFSC